jgi:Diacylglycerol kinase accessory domain
VNVQVQLDTLDSSGKWVERELPEGVRAIVLLNLQSYAGGRDLWRHNASVRLTLIVCVS